MCNLCENKHFMPLLENVCCPLGCDKNDDTVCTGHDLLHDLPGEFTVVKCKFCGLMRTNPRPTPDTIGLYYPDDYGPYKGTQVNTDIQDKNSILKQMLRPLVRTAINFNTTILPRQKPGKMLEIGCASGSFMHEMAQKGWFVEGIEFSPTAAEHAKRLGYKVHIGSLETAPEPEEKFDLIAGWMVLEHLHDPINSLKKLRNWAKPGAWLALSVPNAGSLEFTVFKDKWYALQLPTHLHHFTPQTLEKVLQAGGWKLEKVFHQRVLSNLIASTGYLLRSTGFNTLGQKLVDFPEHAGRWHQMLYPLAWLLGLFGQTGRMTVWARVLE